MWRLFFSPPRRPSTVLNTIEPTLETGDVMLFATTGPDDYLARLGSWHASSQSGFLIRHHPGLEGLQLCHTCLNQGRQMGTTQLISLSQFFNESMFDTVIIRKLCVPLSNDQKCQVADFARESVGTESSHKVTLLMQRTDMPLLCGCCLFSSRSIERFICSELVAKMLLNLEMVRGKNNEYTPVTSSRDGRRICDSTLYQSSIIVHRT